MENQVQQGRAGRGLLPGRRLLVRGVVRGTRFAGRGLGRGPLVTRRQLWGFRSRPRRKAPAAPSVEDLLNMDLEDLARVPVRPQPTAEGVASTVIESSDVDFSGWGTTGELLSESASVSLRRTSALNLDAQIRGYHSEQISASADGMAELKTRVDIDSLFSMIDPGVVRRVEVIDGPYTSLYGPGFAFLVADLFAPQRYPDGPEIHGSTFFTHGSNGRSIYTRQNLWGGGPDWGVAASYGLRTGNDYSTGDPTDYLIPASYNKWDGFFAISRYLDECSRLEFTYLRTELNDVELPGVVYDIRNSHNDQFNLRYVVQDDPAGPEQLVLQYWLHQTAYHGDASNESKQRTLYRSFFTLPNFDDFPVNTFGAGRSDSMGARGLVTLGERDAPQWTWGVDWRRYTQEYREINVDAAGEIVFDGGMFGIPQSGRDDVGLLTHVSLPWNDDLTFTCRRAARLVHLPR